MQLAKYVSSRAVSDHSEAVVPLWFLNIDTALKGIILLSKFMSCFKIIISGIIKI